MKVRKVSFSMVEGQDNYINKYPQISLLLLHVHIISPYMSLSAASISKEKSLVKVIFTSREMDRTIIKQNLRL